MHRFLYHHGKLLVCYFLHEVGCATQCWRCRLEEESGDTVAVLPCHSLHFNSYRRPRSADAVCNWGETECCHKDHAITLPALVCLPAHSEQADIGAWVLVLVLGGTTFPLQLLPTWYAYVCWCHLPSTRSRETHLRNLINEQNRICQPRARLSVDEINSILLLDAAGEEFRNLVAAAHQSEAPQHTAFPLGLLSKDYLQPSFPNPVLLAKQQCVLQHS